MIIYANLCNQLVQALENKDKQAYTRIMREIKLRVEVDFLGNRLKKENDPTKLERICEHCEEIFVVGHESNRKRFCNLSCANLWRFKRIKEAENDRG